MDDIETRLWTAYRTRATIAGRNRLVAHYQPLVRRLAGWMARRMPAWCEVDDLAADGCVGLMEAVERFEPEGVAAFPTFADKRLRGAMVEGMRRRIRQVSAAGPDGPGCVSLETVVGEGSCRLGELLAGVADDPETRAIRRETVGRLLRLCNRAERMVLSLRYAEGMTFAQIARSIGVGRGRVGQIHREAIRKIRKVKGLRDERKTAGNDRPTTTGRTRCGQRKAAEGQS